uniref:Homeobox domain-containing protein n=1 Tax=Lates calcarifer TaxID=8187 RepID=A0A4W6DD65_LATCA
NLALPPIHKKHYTSSHLCLIPARGILTLISETSMEGQRGGREVEEEHRRDKRQRTTITPEQLEVLYQRYSLDSNPTRGVLESIARDVGLTRRVVQVLYGYLLSGFRILEPEKEKDTAPPPSAAAPKDTDESLPDTPAQRLLQEPSYTQSA